MPQTSAFPLILGKKGSHRSLLPWQNRGGNKILCVYAQHVLHLLPQNARIIKFQDIWGWKGVLEYAEIFFVIIIYSYKKYESIA